MLNVVAKPLIGPDPINDNTHAVINVVTLASNIVIKALLYPVVIADLILLLIVNSSLIRSKIIILASTVIPIVNNKPAIPGKVKTASIVINTARTINRFINNAKFAMNKTKILIPPIQKTVSEDQMSKW